MDQSQFTIQLLQKSCRRRRDHIPYHYYQHCTFFWRLQWNLPHEQSLSYTDSALRLRYSDGQARRKLSTISFPPFSPFATHKNGGNSTKREAGNRTPTTESEVQSFHFFFFFCDLRKSRVARPTPLFLNTQQWTCFTDTLHTHTQSYNCKADIDLGLTLPSRLPCYLDLDSEFFLRLLFGDDLELEREPVLERDLERELELEEEEELPDRDDLEDLDLDLDLERERDPFFSIFLSSALRGSGLLLWVSSSSSSLATRSYLDRSASSSSSSYKNKVTLTFTL